MPDDQWILPRVRLTVALFPEQRRMASVNTILDTGAQVSALDGNLAQQAGWTEREIVDRAIAVLPIYGIGPGPGIPGYLHQITAYLGGYTRYAELKLRVLTTPPNTLEFSVLGRSDFFEQVDVTFAESDKKLYFRFRDPAVLHSYA